MVYFLTNCLFLISYNDIQTWIVCLRFWKRTWNSKLPWAWVFIIESWVRVVIWPLSHKSSCEDHRGLQLYFHITSCVKHCLKVSPTFCFSTCIPKKLKVEKREHTKWKHMSICFHFDGLPFTIFVLTPCTSTYISAEILPHILLQPEKQKWTPLIQNWNFNLEIYQYLFLVYT